MNNKKKIIRAVTIDKSLGFVEPMIPLLSKKYDIQLLSSPGEKIDSLCGDFKLKGHRVYMYRRLSPFKDLKSLWQLIRIFKREKPYIVHSMTPKAGLLCMLAAWTTRVPIRIHTFTGLVWPTSSGVIRKILMFTDWITCKCATHVIPEGQGVLDDLKKSITNKPMRILGHGNVRGVDMNRFSRRPEIMEHANTLKTDNVFTFIYVGRIVRDKGINELVSAFDSLSKSQPNIRLFLVGIKEDNLDPISEHTKQIIGSNEKIVAVGPKYNDDLLAYYAASDCFILPSYREGFPNTVLEAGAMGLPCIVTDINGSREIIIHEKNGLIIPSQNTDALYDAMKQIISDKESTLSMASNARNLIESRFERSYVCKCLYDFYEEIIK